MGSATSNETASSETASSGMTSDGTTFGGTTGFAGSTSGHGGGGAGGVGSVDGGSTGGSIVDRCLDPGPPPADGAEDGSEYEFGFTVHLAKDYHHHIAVADLDRDGRPDLLGSDPSRPLVTYRQITGSVIQSAIAVGDLNCDGCPDAVGVAFRDIWIFTGTACARQK